MPVIRVSKVPPMWDALHYDPANKQELYDWLGIDAGSTAPVHISGEGVVYSVDEEHPENAIQTYGWNMNLSVRDNGYIVRVNTGYEVYTAESFPNKYREE